jgi:hypothetical protein
VVLKKSTITTTTTSTIRQPLKAITGGTPQSRKAVISISEQVQQLEQVHEDIPAGSDSMALDLPPDYPRTAAQVPPMQDTEWPTELTPSVMSAGLRTDPGRSSDPGPSPKVKQAGSRINDILGNEGGASFPCSPFAYRYCADH